MCVAGQRDSFHLLERGGTLAASSLHAREVPSPMKHTDCRIRCTFLKSSTAAAAGLLAPSLPVAAAPSTLPALPYEPKATYDMPTRNLCRIRYKVGVSLGGQAIEKPNTFEVAVPIINRALDLSVNDIHTSSIYGGPERCLSETEMSCGVAHSVR